MPKAATRPRRPRIKPIHRGFGADGEKCERGGDVRFLGEKPMGGGESIAAKPAEGLLRTVREEDHAELGEGW